jgi:hypothetical protein
VSLRAARRICTLGAVVLLALSATGWLGAAPAHAAVRPGTVRMTVADVRPNTPLLSLTPKPLVVTLTLANTTGQTLRDVTVSGARGDPLTSQTALDSAIAKPKPPTGNLVAPFKRTYRVTVGPHASVAVDYGITYDIPTDAELCLCQNAIYPLYFTADYTPPTGPTVRLATAQTYLPSFTTQPAKAQLAWVWPLLDRPHRLLSDKLFLDDDLATEVAPGGRLDRLLQVVEGVGRDVPMTLVTDPDLIDELAVMSGGYRVKGSKGSVAGAGQADAAGWLDRLRKVLAVPDMELSLTPFGDPPVETLARAGLSWAVGLSAQAQARVTTALGRALPPSDIAWPANQTISSRTLATLVKQGTKTVIVSDRGLPGGSSLPVVPDALAPLQSASGAAIAAVTSTTIDRWARVVLRPNGPGLGALPQLVAEAAMRVEQSRAQSHFLLISPPRQLNVDPAVAERAILATSRTVWSSPLALRAATGAVTPVSHGRLRNRVPPPSLPASTLSSLDYVTNSLPGLSTLFTDAAGRTAFLGNLPTGVQRAESSSLLAEPKLSVAYSRRLADLVLHLRDGVVLVRPSNGTYTLPSRDSRLPITIANRLAARVTVVVSVASTPGFNADPVKRTIDANSTVQVRVPTRVDRVGRFEVQVSLSTTDGLAISSPLSLSVHSTALGTVGVVITIIAAAVLGAALLIRFIRRMRRRGRPPTTPSTPEPVPAATASP